MVEAAPNNSIKPAPLADPNDRAQTEFTWAPTCWPAGRCELKTESSKTNRA